MNRKAKNGAPWPDEVRTRVGEVYEPTLQWLRTHRKIPLESGREALHEVLKHIRKGLATRIRNWDRYLARATANEVKHSRRKPKIKFFSELTKEEREELHSIPAPGRSPDEEAAQRELVALLREKIKKLPPRQREVLTWELGGKTAKEIQAILGIKSLKTVYAHRQKAIENLRKNPAFREED